MALQSAVSAGRSPQLGPPAVLRDGGRNPVPLLNDVRPGVRDAPGAIILVEASALLQKPAGAPLANPPEPGASTRKKWPTALATSCIFHAAVAALLLVGGAASVLIEGTDNAGSVVIGNAANDDRLAGEPSEQPDVTQVTLVTMLEAQPIATVEAEAVAVDDGTVAIATAATEIIEAEPVQAAEPVRETAAAPVASETARPAPVASVAPEVLTAETISPVQDNSVAPYVESRSAQDAPAENAAAVVSPTLAPVEETAVLAAPPVELAEPLQPDEARQVSPDIVAAAEIQPAEARTSEIRTIEAEEEPGPEVALPDEAPRPQPRKPEPERKTAEKDKPEPKKAEQRPVRQKKAETDKDTEKARESADGAKGKGRTNAKKGVSDGGRDGKTAARGKGGKAGAGNAAVSNYPGKVVAKLRRAARSISRSAIRKAKNDVQVGFTVKANGSVGGIRITRSSGSPELDRAALAVVSRAAPFPPIPEAAGRSNWAFALPLGVAR